jgi:hypothetical protein
MNVKRFQKIVAAMLSVILGAASSQLLYGYRATTSANPGPLNPTETAQQTPAELQSLVAPIALYPDALVAQILDGVHMSRSGGGCGLLAGSEQEPNGKRAYASRR